MIELRRIGRDNIWKVVRLSVTEEQTDFVATNTESILEAFATLSDGCTALPFAIYEDGVPAGFVMFGHGSSGDEDDPPVAADNYVLWRFMIDRAYQGRGLGRAALAASLDYLRTWPCGEAEYCWVSYEPENAAAKALYGSFGFLENGDMCGDEVVAVLKL